jgi:hypothetical protein
MIGERGVLEGRSPSHQISSPPPSKERGNKGVRMIKTKEETYA